jgi:hypothetical protein
MERQNQVAKERINQLTFLVPGFGGTLHITWPKVVSFVL